MINDLKKKLNASETKLTDIRLEALTSVHQIDQLKECVDKMRSDMKALRNENQMLRRHVTDLRTVSVRVRERVPPVVLVDDNCDNQYEPYSNNREAGNQTDRDHDHEIAFDFDQSHMSSSCNNISSSNSGRIENNSISNTSYFYSYGKEI